MYKGTIREGQDYLLLGSNFVAKSEVPWLAGVLKEGVYYLLHWCSAVMLV